jgi:hypothetical protein
VGSIIVSLQGSLLETTIGSAAQVSIQVSQSASSYMIQTFVLVAVALEIASTLAIAAVQKTRQIGILKAMGLADAPAGRTQRSSSSRTTAPSPSEPIASSSSPTAS